MIDLRDVLIPPDSAKTDIIYNVGLSVSPFTGGQQAVELPGARWRLNFAYTNLDLKVYGQPLKAIKAMMRGGSVVALIRDLSYLPRWGTEPGAPFVNGANQSGIVLNTGGWNAGTKFQMGDQISYLSVDGLTRMHIITEPVIANGSGVAFLKILPPIRNPPVDASPLNTVNPSVSVTMQEGGEVSANGQLCSSTLVFVEALYELS